VAVDPAHSADVAAAFTTGFRQQRVALAEGCRLLRLQLFLLFRAGDQEFFDPQTAIMGLAVF